MCEDKFAATPLFCSVQDQLRARRGLAGAGGRGGPAAGGSPSQPMRQTWTIMHPDGPDRLGLWPARPMHQTWTIMHQDGPDRLRLWPARLMRQTWTITHPDGPDRLGRPQVVVGSFGGGAQGPTVLLAACQLLGQLLADPVPQVRNRTRTHRAHTHTRTPHTRRQTTSTRGMLGRANAPCPSSWCLRSSPSRADLSHSRTGECRWRVARKSTLPGQHKRSAELESNSR